MTYEEKQASIVYQIYPKSFYDTNKDGIGDLKGVIEKIPYLVDLGINTLWLSPVYASPMADNGYDISDYCAIHPDYGTMEDMKTLIEKLHEHKIKLIMDLVINHTSDEHPWFMESRKSLNNPKRDFYVWRKGKKGNKKPPNNWTSFFTGKAWTYDETTEEWYLHLFNRKQPDLNWENPKVYLAIKEIIEFWIDLGVDGFRCDVINLLSKNDQFPKGKFRIGLVGKEHYCNGPHIHHLLKHFNRDIFRKHAIMTVGETVFITPEDAVLYVSPERKELDMVFHFEHMGVDNRLKWFLKPFKAINLKKILYKWQFALEGKGINALYFENHDQPRSVSRFGDDQNYHYASATLLATLLFTLRGVPYIYQGQEIGMTNAYFEDLNAYKDIETHSVYEMGRKSLKLSHKRMMKKIKYMSRDNARTPMQWNKEAHAGFTKGNPWIKVNPNHETINVEASIKDGNSILNFYKHLIKLRKEEPALVYGRFQPYLSHHKSLYVYTRTFKNDTILVIGNHHHKKTKLPIVKNLKVQGKILLSNYPLTSNDIPEVIEPYAVFVVKLDQ